MREMEEFRILRRRGLLAFWERKEFGFWFQFANRITCCVNLLVLLSVSSCCFSLLKIIPFSHFFQSSLSSFIFS